MNSASRVDELFEKWKKAGDSKRDLIIKTADAEVGWPYVWGAVGAQCTPAKREYYANRSSCPEAESKVTIQKCQALNGSGKSCGGCTYYPGEQRTLIDDCQGFVKQICSRVGISFSGGGATSMWNGASNWVQKGKRNTLPETLCCIFWQNSDGSTMNHIGFYIGNGEMIHCSGTVKREKISARVTHWAIPRGLDGNVPEDKPTLRRGSSGDYVLELQKDLMKLGYDVGATGADGKFGSKTEVAVKAFQANNQLSADGICGPKTWMALDQAIKPEPTPTPTPTPTEKLYTVTIPHVPKSKASALKKEWPGATAKAE